MMGADVVVRQDIDLASSLQTFEIKVVDIKTFPARYRTALV